ncbi:hypothetical protein [Ornithinimicrobium murale]|uniref:hypothetical protein n=1 Tax=Ornithinimicrobium murale TaxID=1050153 RepID=UPI0013B39D9B|nr:hypothetical protein [Ornithinimicrobium murale]
MSENRYPHMSTADLRDFRESLSKRPSSEIDGMAAFFMAWALGLAVVVALLGFVAQLGGLVVLSWIFFGLALPPAAILLLLWVTQGPIAAAVTTARMRRSADKELTRRGQDSQI